MSLFLLPDNTLIKKEPFWVLGRDTQISWNRSILAIRPVTTFIRKGNEVSLLLGQHTVSLGSEEFLLLRLDTTYKRKVSVLAIVAGHGNYLLRREVSLHSGRKNHNDQFDSKAWEDQ